MSIEEKVVSLGKKLESMIGEKKMDNEKAKELLVKLNEANLDLKILQKTSIGKTVNNLRKVSNDDHLSTMAKNLIKKWKKMLPESGEKPPVGGPQIINENSNSSANSDDFRAKIEKKPSTSAKFSETTDPVRLKCRDMLAAALKLGEIPETSSDPDDLAAAVEECIFQEFKNTDVKYKNRLRSRIANLKDKRNPKLREDVLLRYLTPERFAVMTPEDMASDELKRQRALFTKQAIDDHQLSVATGTKTDLLQCGKCKKRSCSYTQAQTRSADEPMTTFALCHDCGHRWKFC